MATTRKWIRVTKNNLCPVCGKPDWCVISRNEKVVICARIENDKPAGNKGAGWIHTFNSSTPLLPLKPKQPERESQKAVPDVLHNAYSALLVELKLSEVHRANLQQRGLTDTEIDSLNYRTLPAKGRLELVNGLRAKNVKLAGVPGFYLVAGEPRLAGPVGIVIPVRNIGGRITGLQIRCDNVDTGCYKWLSSRGYNAGCSPGVSVHVAGPVSTSGEVWITEGAIKADIAALKLGRVVLAVPGVGNWSGVIPIVRELAPARVISAFDMDKSSNSAVKLHSDALMTCLIKFGVRTFEADWDTHFKGLDNLLTGEL